MEETTLTVHGEEYPGRLTVPDVETERGVLVVPGAGHGPFGDVFDGFAEAATDAGHLVARFRTWTGPDDLEAKTAADFREEICAGIDLLRARGCTTVAVVAKSFGGRLALEHATDEADRMVLWAPAVLFGSHDDAPSIAPETLRSIEIPVLVLQGDEDDVVPAENGKSIADRIPGGTFVKLPGEDHSFVTDQERIIEKTCAFLSA